MAFSQKQYLGFAAFALVIFALLAVEVYFNLSITGFDHAFNQGLSVHQGFLWSFSLLIDAIFGTKGFIVICIALAALCIVRKRKSHALFVLITMLLTGGLGYVFKLLIHRVRPETILVENDFSFPSGHALYSFVLLALVFYLFVSSHESIRTRRIWAFVFTLVILAVAFSRLYLQVHWFSDILGGWALGIVCFSLAAWIHEKYKHLDKKNIGF